MNKNAVWREKSRVRNIRIVADRGVVDNVRRAKNVA
jgi:hypothetical protein